MDAPARPVDAAPAATTDPALATLAAAAATSTASTGQQAHDGTSSQHRPPTREAVEALTASAGTTPTAVPAAAPATPVATAPLAANAPASTVVTSQVMPVVSRLVTRGDGTHRITIKLNPEALGEVRVVLTLRAGEVHVRLAGSDQAQRALLHGSGELHRLLESAGARSSEIVVGDQSTTSGGRQDGSSDRRDQLGSQDGTSTGQHSAQGRGHTNDRTAGTRDGDTSARDGVHRGAQPRPADPGTRTRITGVDVTM